MPWLAVPFEESALRARLGSKFGVEGIPRLVIVGPDGAVSGVQPICAALLRYSTVVLWYQVADWPAGRLAGAQRCAHSRPK